MKTVLFNKYYPKIVTAAIKVGPMIFTGKRHCEIIREVCRALDKVYCDDEQGFMGDNGKFYTREAALTIVTKTGQLTKPLIGSVLTSEDLW